mgnify:CR=1 FL=1
MHKKVKEEKSNKWMLKMAKDADIVLGDDLENQINEDGEPVKKKKRAQREILAPVDVFETDLKRLEGKAEGGARHKTKELSKV